MHANRVTAVTVTYNSGHAIADCLDSVRGCALVVVDNASADDTLVHVRAGFPDARIVANTANEGFGRANNRGWALATTDFVLFINPDARLTPGSLDRLLEAAWRHPEAALIAPRIVRPGGRVEVSHDVDLWRRGEMPPGPAMTPEGEICADFLSGAVFLLRRSALEGYPPFDPAIFLYYEDDDLCLRLRRDGHAL
ncbi:MAG: glycosyltransferase family 2 protein, partial [Alphaproteobacteria bacterium]|nr:glycosyltransferase family 2 protein [Alphaproteobacteria bacterium]